MRIRTNFRLPCGFTFLLLLSILILSRGASAAATPPLRVWMPLQGVGPGWHGGMLQPLVDGKIQEEEYANGIKIDLNDFTDSAAGGNGRLYASIADNVGFTAQACLKPDGTGCDGGTLFLGLQVHADSGQLGNESGTVVIYLDASRQKSLDMNSCKDNNIPNRKPAPEDRKIAIAYSSAAGQAQPTLTIREYKGNCRGWVEITPPALDPLSEAWNFSATALETLGRPGFLTFEIAITAQPRSAPLFTSQIVNEKLFGLGVLHSANTRFSYGSFGHFPSIFNQKPADLDTWTWATMDLAEPKRIDLSMTAYNVGQLQIAGDGGQGEAEDFAKLTFRNDVICMVEQMNESEREEVVKLINNKRKDEGLDPMTPVYPQSGEAPNNMLLVAGPVIDSDFVLYGDLPEVSAKCADEFDFNPFGGGECLADGAGYKGIVWARVGVKKSTAAPKGGKPVTWFGDHFVDVFCTHTQADYEWDGEFANTEWCYDTIGSAAVGKNCIQSPFAPPDNPWQVNIRREQWQALKNWSHAKRAGGNGSPNGLDRPAFVLGDFNQIAPKAVSFDHPVEDVETWVSNTGNQNGFGTEYKTMRQELGTWPVASFDQASGWNWDLYDLLARDKNGTWIGNGTESAIPSTQADDCITGSQFSGYDTIGQLPKEARLDYILVLPAESGFPFYSLTGPSENPGEPVVTISANAGDWADGLGCASDHAQVSARIGLVQTGIKTNFNPNKQHRVTYRVSHLYDVNDADNQETDWYVNFNQFEMERLDAANNAVELRQKSFPITEGRKASVKWSDSLVVTNGEKARMGVFVWDSDWPSADDLYDGTSFGSGFLGPHFEFDSTYPGTFKLIGDLFSAGGSFLGTADASAVDPDGSCAHGCLGVKTEGNGDGVDPGENVRVTQNIQIEEVH